VYGSPEVIKGRQFARRIGEREREGRSFNESVAKELVIRRN
jgi:hypothetical protein